MTPALVDTEQGYLTHIATRARIRHVLRSGISTNAARDEVWKRRLLWSDLLTYATPMHRIRVHVPSGPWECRADPDTIREWRRTWRVEVLDRDPSEGARRPRECAWTHEP